MHATASQETCHRQLNVEPGGVPRRRTQCLLPRPLDGHPVSCAVPSREWVGHMRAIPDPILTIGLTCRDGREADRDDCRGETRMASR